MHTRGFTMEVVFTPGALISRSHSLCSSSQYKTSCTIPVSNKGNVHISIDLLRSVRLNTVCNLPKGYFNESSMYSTSCCFPIVTRTSWDLHSCQPASPNDCAKEANAGRAEPGTGSYAATHSKHHKTRKNVQGCKTKAWPVDLRMPAQFFHSPKIPLLQVPDIGHFCALPSLAWRRIGDG